MAERNDGARMGEHGGLVRRLHIHRALAVIIRDRQPGRARAEPGLRLLRLPRDRRAAAVAPLGPGEIEIADGVVNILLLEVDLRQAQLLALIHQHRALEGDEQRERELGERIVALPAAPAGDGADDIVIGKGHARREVRQVLQQPLVIIAEDGRREGEILDEGEGIGAVEMLGPGIGAQHFRPLGELAESETAFIFVHHLAHFAHRPLILGRVRVVNMLLQARRMGPVEECPLLARGRRIVR